MKIALRAQEYSKAQRQALWWHFNGSPGYVGDPDNCPMASRDDCRHFLEMYGRSRDQDLNHDWYRDCMRHQERQEEARWQAQRP